MKKLTIEEVAHKLYEALKIANDQLYCGGFGNKWEIECAKHHKIPEQIDEAIQLYETIQKQMKV
jgi:hypothetical protein